VVRNGTSEDSPNYEHALTLARAIQENSHTPEYALGYILAELERNGKAPRLAVGTHFQASDDTIIPALARIRSKYPKDKGDVTVATDFMVINVSKTRIETVRAVVSDYSWDAPPAISGNIVTPKYNDLNSTNPYYPYAPLKQFNQWLLAHVIPACEYDANSFACTNPYHPNI
jgi:ribonuclease Z